MKLILLSAIFLMNATAQAATSCLAFMKDSEGRNVWVLHRQTLPEGKRELGSHDGITVTVTPATAENSNIIVSIDNDRREQMLAGATVWMSGEFLSRTREAYWILIDCEPAAN